MNEEVMQLWSVTSVSRGRLHTAIVQDITMQAAITQYCDRFPGRMDMVTIQGRALQLNRYDNFGKLKSGIAEIPA